MNSEKALLTEKLTENTNVLLFDEKIRFMGVINHFLSVVSCPLQLETGLGEFVCLSVELLSAENVLLLHNRTCFLSFSVRFSKTLKKILKNFCRLCWEL